MPARLQPRSRDSWTVALEGTLHSTDKEIEARGGEGHASGRGRSWAWAQAVSHSFIPSTLIQCLFPARHAPSSPKNMRASLSHLLNKLFIKHLLCARLGARMQQETEQKCPRILGESECDRINTDTHPKAARTVKSTGEGGGERRWRGDFQAGC